MDTQIADNSGNVASPATSTQPKSTNTKPLNPLLSDSALANLIDEIEKGPKTDAPEQTTDEPEALTPPENPEATAETEAEPAEADIPDLSQTEEEKPKDSPRVQQRINELVAQKKSAEEKAQQLENELQQLRQRQEELEKQPPPANGASPLAEVWDDAKLGEEFRKARELRKWCEKHKDGAVVGERELSADEVLEIRQKVDDVLEVHIPERQQFLHEYRHTVQAVESDFPWWKDRTAPEYQQAESALRTPLGRMLKSTSPQHKYFVSLLVEGKKALDARKAAAAKPAPKTSAVKPAPKQPAAPTAQPSRISPKTAEQEAAKKKFLKTGSETELANLLGQFV